MLVSEVKDRLRDSYPEVEVLRSGHVGEYCTGLHLVKSAQMNELMG